MSSGSAGSHSAAADIMGFEPTRAAVKTNGDEAAAQDSARPLQASTFSTPASPAMSLSSPNLSSLPGAMPSMYEVLDTRPPVTPKGANPTLPAVAAMPLAHSTPPASLPASTSAVGAISSFLKSLSITTGESPNGTRSNGRPASPAMSRLPSLDTTSNAVRTSPTSPLTPIQPSPLNGGTQMKRTGSQSNGARPFRRLSGALPSLLGPNTPISSGRSGSPANRNDGEQTPTQANTSSSGGILNTSFSFLSNLASLDKLPPLLGLRAEKDIFPRGQSDSRTGEDIREGEGLKIEEAVANGETFDEIQDSGIAVDSAEDPDPISRTNTLATLDSETSTKYALSPAASISQSAAMASSSESLPRSQDEGLAMATTATPKRGAQQHRRNSTLDPLTFQAITRTSSEAEAMKVVRERAQRGRQLDLADRIKQEAENPIRKQVSLSPAPEPRGIVPVRQAGLQSPVRVDSPSKPSAAIAKSTDQSLAIGLGRPVSTSTAPASAGATQTPEPKKRKKSIFGRLGFSPSGKAPKTPPPPLPMTPHSSVPSIGLPASQSASSFGSFAAVAEAVPNRPSSASPESRAGSALSRTTEAADTAADQYDAVHAPPSESAHSRAEARPQAAGGKSDKNRYIKTKSKNKSRREFDHLFLAQELFHQPPSLSGSMPTTAVPPVTSSSPPTATQAVPPASPSQYAVYPAESATPAPASGASTSGSRIRTPAPDTAKSKRVRPGTTAIWSLKMSPDGNYLASAGQDGVVRIWQVIYGGEEREAVIAASAMSREQTTSHAETKTPDGKGKQQKAKMTEKERRNTQTSTASRDVCCPISVYKADHQTDAAGSHVTTMPVFAHEPLHEWTGHTSDILDLSWSKNNFLLSSSMDKTVRLWHVSRKECLCAFQHLDFVTSIAFHPRDDRYFVSGSLDAKLRLWSIPDKKVHCWTQLPELITCVSFTTDGKLVIAGTFVGLCLFFEVHDLSFVTKLHSKSTRGKNAKGRKITSIVPLPKGEPSEPERLLITSNDSRIRLWNVQHVVAAQTSGLTAVMSVKVIPEKHLEAKYRFHENTSSQIKATFSDDGRYVISGSEDRQAYIWQSGLLDFPSPFAQTSKKTADKSPGYEVFSPAPASAVGMHSNANDASTSGTAGIVTCAIFAPLETKLTLARGGDPLFGEPEEQRNSAPYLRRSASHASTASSLFAPASVSGRSEEGSVASATTSSADGCIIITADDQSGVIRIYRNNAIFSNGDSAKPRDRKNSNLTDRSEGGAEKRTSFFSQTSSGNRRFSIISRTTSRTRHSTNDQTIGSKQTRNSVEQNDLEELA